MNYGCGDPVAGGQWLVSKRDAAHIFLVRDAGGSAQSRAAIRTRHFDHLAYRVCVAGAPIGIVRIVTPRKPQALATRSFQPKHESDAARESA